MFLLLLLNLARGIWDVASFFLLGLRSCRIILFYLLSFDRMGGKCLDLPISRYEIMVTIATPRLFPH